MDYRDLIIGVLVIVAGASLMLNVVLTIKVNNQKKSNRNERKTARMTISSIVRTVSTLEETASRLEVTVANLNEQLDIAADVVYKFQQGNKKLREDMEKEAYAAADVQNRLRKYLYEGRIIRTVWSDNYIETYDPNKMSVNEVAEILGHPID